MNPEIGQANLAFACALVDELAAHGLRHAVVCPGSRSTPVAVALASHPEIRVWVLVDERSAAFFALGMARSLAAPVALLCTSGTAAANFLPAVAEAHLSRIPLVVLTADRPPELRDWGAAQTIDQAGMYGSHATWAADLPVPGVPHQARQARSFAARAWNSALTAPAGPVHLNLPFREPLLPTIGDLRHEADRCFAAERYSVAEPAFGPGSNGISNHDAEAVATVLVGEPRGIIVCGPESIPDPRFPSAVADLSAATGYPVLADALSGVRFGPHDRAGIIDAYDGFVRHLDLIPGLLPDVVIRTGAIPTSKPLQLFLARSAAKHHILVDPGDPRDPSHLATTHLRANPAEALSEIAAAVRARGAFPDAGWRRCW